MYPANQYMDPYYSHYRNHTPYSYYPPPGWETSHPRAMDSSFRPPSYGPWPYNAGMHHPHPSELHCCCNHTYPPGYYNFRPPFPQELPPPHLYYHGPFPQHPNECSSYFVRPHPYPVEQTPYDYNKSHCCGCPNHVCHGGEKNNVKIEEERPDGKPENEQKDADTASIIRHPNNQYPFVWLPSGNMEGKENGSRYELPPQFLNGWVPVSSKRTGDVKQHEQDNQKAKQFQWPIVWMPAGYDEPKQKVKELEMDESPKVSEETPPPKIKIIPLSWFENGHHDQKPAAKDGSGDHSDRSSVKSQPATTEHRDGAAVERNLKTTPVVPKRLNDERRPAREIFKTIPIVPEKEIDEKVGTLRTIPVMTGKESDQKKPGVSEKKEVKKASNAERKGDNGKTNHGESSTAKHSKLPPVCLRVDPLPRKKSGNGSSRSPSPPTRKDADKAKKDVKEAQSQNLEPKQSDTKKHITLPEVKEKSQDKMEKGIGNTNETVQAAAANHMKHEEIPTIKDDQKVASVAMSLLADSTQENAGAESLQEGDKITNDDEIKIQSEAVKDDGGTCRTGLSEQDAAIRIQSAYRGYDVRRWKPLDKLRKIRDVHEQMQSVSRQLQSLEVASEKPAEKEQVAIGESIMSLLLKLDTIQGLHPTVREARKSVARELICLQEKLDTLCKLPSGESNHTNGESNHTNSVSEEPERAESVIHTAAEASMEEDVRQLCETQEPSSMESMKLCNTASDASRELRQVADPTEQKHQIEQSSATTMEEAPGEDKAARQTDELQVPLVDSMEPLHDAASSGDSSELKERTASTEQNLHTEELNAWVSPAATEDDSTVAVATASVANVEAPDKDDPVVGQVHEAAAVETLELNHEVSPAEEDQQKESSSLDAHLEDLSVPLKDAEPHELDPILTIDSVLSNVDDQPEAARDINMQEQVADITQYSTKEPDGTPEASTNDIELVDSADVEEPVQAPLLEPTLESDSCPEETGLESGDALQSDVYGKDDPPHEDQKNEPTVDNLAVGSANGEPPLEATRKESDIQESHPNLAKEADDTRAETVLPELDSCELSCADEMKVSLENQTDSQNDHVCLDSLRTDVQASEADECTKMPKEAPVSAMGANCAGEVCVRVSETGECNELPNDPPVRVIGVNSAEEEADNPKEDVGVQTETKPSEEAFSAAAGLGDLKDSDEKRLAEENQKLKGLLQKLLASGNDQMGVIIDLSEKVKVLERKLACKKRPKLRVHRPSRQAMAKVH
uniref:BAG domain-containing protein n=1 Tax=Arundo donax TaxID=35708 RepID=A0A0A9DJB4_ARUDO